MRRNSLVWLSTVLAFFMLCAMLLTPSGWGVIPSAQAGGPSTIQLTASASGQSIILNWTADTSNTPGFSGYYIYRGTHSGGESASPLHDFPITQTTFTDNPASSGTYYYIVRPVYNSITLGAPSNEASATVTVVATGGVTMVLHVGQPIMTVNGVTKELDPGYATTPVLNEGRVFVPIRSIVDAMGGIILWNSQQKRLVILVGANEIQLWIGQYTARVNGATKTLDVAPYVSDTGRTMLPLRFITENLGCQVAWEGATQKITIIYTGPTGPSSVAGNPTAGVGVAGTEPVDPVEDVTGSEPFMKEPATPAIVDRGPFNGFWKVEELFNSGKDYMYLVQDGSQLKGNWGNDTVITGTINGNTFTGRHYKGPNSITNTIHMTLTDDGQGFVGSYDYSTSLRPFTGEKDTAANAKITATPTPGAPAANFTGTWANNAAGADIVLTQSGDQVSGTWGDKTMSGTVTGNVVNGRYYKTSFPDLFWDFNLTMSEDGLGFVGWHSRQVGSTFNPIGGQIFTGTKRH